jgi:hypothetical protein
MKSETIPNAVRLNQLENNEAVLLMYRADELPAEDKAEVESLIERDAGFRRQWQDLQAADAATNALIAGGDRVTATPSAFAAARHFGDLVRAKQAEPKPVDVEPVAASRFRWMILPAAAAALLALGMFAWFHTASNKLSERLASEENPRAFPSSAYQQLAEWDPFDTTVTTSQTQQELQLLSSLREDTLR